MLIVYLQASIGYKRCRRLIMMVLRLCWDMVPIISGPVFLISLSGLKLFIRPFNIYHLRWRVFLIWVLGAIFPIKRDYFSNKKDFPPSIIFQVAMMICL